jgi:hypothetical protein
MRGMQARGAAAGRSGTRPAVGRDRSRQFSVWYRHPSKQTGGRSAGTPARTASLRQRANQRRAEIQPRPRARFAGRVAQSVRSTAAGRGGPWRRQRQGRISGLLTTASGALSSRMPRSRSKTGVAALALAAGAGGLAVAKRRRSAAANEPLGQTFPVDDERMGAQGSMGDRSPEEPSTAHAPDAEGSNAASKGGRASKGKRGVE